MEKLAGHSPPCAQHHAGCSPGCRDPVQSHANILSRNSQSRAGVPAGILRPLKSARTPMTGGLHSRFIALVEYGDPSVTVACGLRCARKMPAGTPALPKPALDRRLRVQVLPPLLALGCAAGQVLS